VCVSDANPPDVLPPTGDVKVTPVPNGLVLLGGELPFANEVSATFGPLEGEGTGAAFFLPRNSVAPPSCALVLLADGPLGLALFRFWLPPIRRLSPDCLLVYPIRFSPICFCSSMSRYWCFSRAN